MAKKKVKYRVELEKHAFVVDDGTEGKVAKEVQRYTDYRYFQNVDDCTATVISCEPFLDNKKKVKFKAVLEKHGIFEDDGTEGKIAHDVQLAAEALYYQDSDRCTTTVISCVDLD